jgi:hypothetical protein
MVVIKKKLRFIIFVLIFVIVSPIVVLYAKGDIFTDGWNILQTGGIYATKAPLGSEIFLNGKSQGTTSFFSRDFLLKNLRPGTYTISAQKTGYNSWDEKVQVKNNLVSDANIFILPTQIPLQEIPKYTSTTTKIRNQEYTDIAAVFASSSSIIPKKILLATTTDFKNNFGIKQSPIMSGKVGLWQEGDVIYSAWFGNDDAAPKYFCDAVDCTKTITVYDTEAAIRRINFLPDYDGVAVVATGNEIYAIQIENNPDKKPQLIYQGSAPDFRIIDGDLYVKDGTFIAQVQL